MATPHPPIVVSPWLERTSWFASGVALAPLAARWHWAIEVLTHGYLQCFLVLVALAGVWCCLWWRSRRWRPAATAVMAALVFQGVWDGRTPRADPPVGVSASERAALRRGNDDNNGSPQASVEPLRATAINLLYSNQDAPAVLAEIKAEHPDILVLVEFTPQWRDRCESLTESHPFHASWPQEDPFGVGVYSRGRIISRRHQTVHGHGIAMVEVSLDSGPLRVIAAHPPPPLSGYRARVRNDYLSLCAAWAAEPGPPVLLMGDLNLTPWSPYFSRLLQDGRLVDTRGRGFHTSWPAGAPWPLRIPIDHVLVSPELRVVSRGVGGGVGSDHLPVLVTLERPYISSGR